MILILILLTPLWLLLICAAYAPLGWVLALPICMAAFYLAHGPGLFFTAFGALIGTMLWIQRTN
jgi:hypothetical protein